MCAPRSLIASGNASRARRLVEFINTQPINVRQLAFGTISRASDSNPAILDAALDGPNFFIQQIRESIEPAVASPSPANPPAGSRTLALMDLLRSEPMEIRELAHAILLSAGDDPSPGSQVDNALNDPRGFIQQMRVFAQLNVQPDEVQHYGAQQSASQDGTRPSLSETLEGLDPEVFHGLPDEIRAEILSLMPSDPQPAQRASVDVGRPVSQTDRPEAATASPSEPSGPAEERVEEVSWPRIHEWLQSRTGPRPQVLCVWCQEELVIAEGDLQPENGEREPAYQFPCSHVVGESCLRNSLELYGVRVSRCPYCRAEIGDVYS